MVADLRYFNSLKLEVDSLKSQLETQKTQFLNEIDQLFREYYYADHMNAILGVYTELDEVTNLQCDYLELLEKYECLEKELSKSKMMSKSFEALLKHADLKAQLQDKGIVIRVILTTSVRRPRLKSNPMGDRVMRNNSQGKKQDVEDHRRSVKFSKNKTFVTACNDSLKAKTLNVNFVCATCGKCVLNEKHDMCVLKSVNGVNSRIKMPIVVPVSTRELKCTVKQSVAKPPKKILVEIVLFIVDSRCSKHMTGNLKLLINFVEKFLGTVKFGNDQITPILGYGDLVQGAVIIKWVYYIEGLNHNLFSVDQFCDANLEVAFRKSTCYIRDLKGNDLLTGSRGTDLYSITLQETNSPNPIRLMAKATSSHAWLWHHRLSRLNFDTINLLSKNDIVVGLLKIKFVKYHLCSSCELGKAKRKSFHTKITPSSKRRLQLLHMNLCGPMRVESINGKRYVLVIVDDYSRYTWTQFLRSKDETPEVLIDFLRLVQRGLHAQVRIIRTNKGTEFLSKTLHAYFASDGILHQTLVARTPEQNGSRAYRVFNKRTRVIVETIHVNFDELPQMASDHVSFDPGPECQRTTLEHDSLNPDPQCQENVTQADRTVTTSNEMDLLFSLMFTELLNGSSQVVSKTFVVSTADAPNQLENDEFINIFRTLVQDRGETSSQHVDSSIMHTFYQHHPSEHRWTKDHPLEQAIGNPSQSIRTRRQLESDGEMCMFALTVSQTEPKNIKEAMADSAWIESMQEKLHRFDRLDVWELIDKPLCKNVINMKWFWKNKRDEENTIIRNKSRHSHLVQSSPAFAEDRNPARAIIKQALGSCVRRSYALSWKSCQGDSLNLSDHSLRFGVFILCLDYSVTRIKLLSHQKGCKSTVKVRTINEQIYPTYRAACEALGLLGDDREWEIALEESAVSATSSKTRTPFAQLLIYYEVSDLAKLWRKHWQAMRDDIPAKVSKATGIPNYNVNTTKLQDYILYEMEGILNGFRKFVNEFGLPSPP
nr:retrovirus-related Pol polyprotein from transposon TNT 1-94 [Tanacetum cinerariifolium]